MWDFAAAHAWPTVLTFKRLPHRGQTAITPSSVITRGHSPAGAGLPWPGTARTAWRLLRLLRGRWANLSNPGMMILPVGCPVLDPGLMDVVLVVLAVVVYVVVVVWVVVYGVGRPGLTYGRCRSRTGRVAGLALIRAVTDGETFIPPVNQHVLTHRGDRWWSLTEPDSSMCPERVNGRTILDRHYSVNRAGRCWRSARMRSHLPGEDSASYTLRPAVKAIAASSMFRTYRPGACT